MSSFLKGSKCVSEFISSLNTVQECSLVLSTYQEELKALEASLCSWRDRSKKNDVLIIANRSKLLRKQRFFEQLQDEMNTFTEREIKYQTAFNYISKLFDPICQLFRNEEEILDFTPDLAHYLISQLRQFSQNNSIEFSSSFFQSVSISRDDLFSDSHINIDLVFQFDDILRNNVPLGKKQLAKKKKKYLQIKSVLDQLENTYSSLYEFQQTCFKEIIAIQEQIVVLKQLQQTVFALKKVFLSVLQEEKEEQSLKMNYISEFVHFSVPDELFSSLLSMSQSDLVFFLDIFSSHLNDLSWGVWCFRSFPSSRYDLLFSLSPVMREFVKDHFPLNDEQWSILSWNTPDNIMLSALSGSSDSECFFLSNTSEDFSFFDKKILYLSNGRPSITTSITTPLLLQGAHLTYRSASRRIESADSYDLILIHSGSCSHSDVRHYKQNYSSGSFKRLVVLPPHIRASHILSFVQKKMCLYQKSAS